MYRISKLMLNSLYGKFALNPKVRGKEPYLENGIVKYRFYPEEIRDPVYIPVRYFYYKLCKAKNNNYKSKNKRLYYK